MAVSAVIGLQWGDEAKGKLVDLLTDQHEIVVRYLGGNNAGHTVKFGGQTYKLSLLPAGTLRPGVTSVIASGTVINPGALLGEIDGLTERGIGVSADDSGGLLISERAHVIMPYHLAEDAALEAQRGDKAIGTTQRGIGPCYRDKIGRTHAIRIGDLVDPDRFRQRLDEVVPAKNSRLKTLGSDKQFEVDAILADYSAFADRLRPHVRDTVHLLHDWIDDGRTMLFEGAQGSLLDVDHGTFPYVTSSNSSGVGIAVGSGVPARRIDRMYGVVKAYTTRVGGGPCPTELDDGPDGIGQHIRDEGNEYGTVTRRPRRCGWFDAVATRYGARISGVDRLGVMLLDVLSKLPELKICEAYELNGERSERFPADARSLSEAHPVYRTLPGWEEPISHCRTFSELPANAQRYVETIGELIGIPVALVSIGPDRDETIWIEPPSS